MRHTCTSCLCTGFVLDNILRKATSKKEEELSFILERRKQGIQKALQVMERQYAMLCSNTFAGWLSLRFMQMSKTALKPHLSWPKG